MQLGNILQTLRRLEYLYGENGHLVRSDCDHGNVPILTSCPSKKQIKIDIYYYYYLLNNIISYLEYYTYFMEDEKDIDDLFRLRIELWFKKHSMNDLSANYIFIIKF